MPRLVQDRNMGRCISSHFLARHDNNRWFRGEFGTVSHGIEERMGIFRIQRNENFGIANQLRHPMQL
jgi:hypothetical protein